MSLIYAKKSLENSLNTGCLSYGTVTETCPISSGQGKTHPLWVYLDNVSLIFCPKTPQIEIEIAEKKVFRGARGEENIGESLERFHL